MPTKYPEEYQPPHCPTSCTMCNLYQKVSQYRSWLLEETARINERFRSLSGSGFSPVKLGKMPTETIHQNQPVIRLNTIFKAINDTATIWFSLRNQFPEDFDDSDHCLRLRLDLLRASINAFNTFYLTKEQWELAIKQRYEKFIKNFVESINPENSESLTINQQISDPELGGAREDEEQA